MLESREGRSGAVIKEQVALSTEKENRTRKRLDASRGGR
jgi:hypothetical protein